MDNTLGEAFAVGNPLLDLRCRIRIRTELGVHCRLRFLNKVGKDIVGLAIGNDNLYSFVGNLTGNVNFGNHSATTEVALAGLDILTEVTVVVDHRDNTRVSVGRITIIYSVDIGENDESICRHHRSHKSGKLIIIGEHQLSDAGGIVLIDNRKHSVLKHNIHAGTLIEVFATGGKTLLHRQHLTDMHAILTEEIIVKTDELHLSEGREELPLRHTVEFMVDLQFITTRSHRT